MEGNILEDGLKGSNTEKEFLFLRMDRRNKVNGKME